MKVLMLDDIGIDLTLADRLIKEVDNVRRKKQD